MFAKTFAVLGLASFASAHIIMTNPVPLGSPNNSPLEADGSNFPCKGPVTGGSASDNVYEQGSIQQLAFQGTAVHGGGSCQVSVTTDLNPTRDSVWKVIKSIEGGCPARDQEGNMGNSAEAEVPYTYDFTIPQDLATGEYVFAWTWFNKVGNREMYMNCAAVAVTGSGGSDGFLDTLPDMFVANVGNGCRVEDSKDVKFPFPGNDVEQLNGATEAFFSPTEAACMGNGGSPAPEPTSPPTQPEDPPAPSPTSAPTASIPGGIFITVTTSGATAPTEAPETPETPAEPTPEEPTPEEPAPEEPTPEEPTPEVPVGEGAVAPGTVCAEEGAWNCVGGNSFQRCASGSWTPVMALAAGMTCEAGQNTELKVTRREAKHFMRRALRVKA